jgi:ubiquinone biosynthesis UbiH/UbiF/VisC/COQ6 family hydroxylase
MPSMNNLDILVRGAGAVGLTAALALSRLGLRVAVQDLQAGAASTGQAAPQQDVRAYALNAASVRLLADLKVWEAIPGDARTAVHDMHIEGDVPGASLDFSAWSQGLAELAWIVDAAELETALRTAARFAPHLVTLPHGTAAEPTAALQVLAEGKASDSRARLGVGVQRHDYGHRAIAARLRCDRPHAGLARQWFRSPDVLALLPLDRPQPGHGFGLVWSLPEERAAELLGLSAADFEAALNDATGAAAGTLCLASERVGWPLSLQQAQAVHGPGWVLVGDAAHVVHPLAGQGLNLGLADVAALAQVLAERARQEPWRALGDPRLLARYARARAAPTRAMALVTDGLLQLFAHPQPLVRELRNRGMGLVNQVPAFKRLLIQQALGN